MSSENIYIYSTTNFYQHVKKMGIIICYMPFMEIMDALVYSIYLMHRCIILIDKDK